MAVHNTLKEFHDNDLSDAEMKDVIDTIYTALYSSHFYKESDSADDFIRVHSSQAQEIEGEVELLEGFEG